MLPFRYSTLFRNRWFAVLWGAGICYMAVEIVGQEPQVASTEVGQGTDITGSPVSKESLDALEAFAGGKK
jgi:hypothetical protein